MRFRHLAVVLLGAGLAAHGALSRRPLCVVPQAGQPPSGAADWTRAAVLGPFVRNDGAGMPAAGTLARICRTADALCLRVECQEPQMAALRAGVTQRDGMVWVDDCVEVFVQAPGQRAYAHFVVNPLGTAFDELVRDSSWNAAWECAAGRGEGSWWCELRIPFAALGGAPGKDADWGLNVCRSRRPEPELSAWSATGAGFHQPERLGTVRFADQPWPTAVTWSWPSRRDVAAVLTWRPEGVGANLQVTINGTPADKPVRLEREGTVPLWLEARLGQTPVYRACFVADITPMSGALQAARAALQGLPEAEVAALTARLGALEALRDQAGPALAADIAAQARELELRASRLKLRAEIGRASCRERVWTVV